MALLVKDCTETLLTTQHNVSKKATFLIVLFCFVFYFLLTAFYLESKAIYYVLDIFFGTPHVRTRSILHK